MNDGADKMNEDEKRLEAQIDRELKALPEVAAPATLVARVMATLERRARAPWYRQSWQAWPVPAQAACLLVLLTAFGMLCFAPWSLPQVGTVGVVTHKVAAFTLSVSALWQALTSLGAAVALALKQLGAGFLIGALLALGLAWAVCLGLGTACAKLALARH
jgi:hypothetical protein